MKHTNKAKILSMMLSLLLLIQIVPISVFANGNEDAGVTDNLSANGSEYDENPNILFEIEENRTEYSKEFVLNDGSYYCVATAYPMHTEIDGRWENISNSFNSVENIENTDEVVDALVSGVSEIAEQNISAVATYNAQTSEQIPISKSQLTREYSANLSLGTIISPDGAIKVNMNDLNNKLHSDRVIKAANITFSYSSSSSNEIYAYEGKAESSTSSTINDFKLIDKKTVSGKGNIEFDITDTVNRWSLGKINNNGIVIRSKGSKNTTVNNFVITLNYETVESNDINFTYHIVDMGNAGYAYINNYTNTMWIEQPIVNVDSNVLSGNISLFNDSVRPEIDVIATCGFTLNVESSLSITDDNSIVWDTISFEKKYFYVEELTPTTTGEYYVCKAYDGLEYQDNNSVLLYIPTSEFDEGEINFENIFITHKDTKYRFNSFGQLSSIERPGANNTTAVVTLEHDSNGRISSLLTEKNTVYTFEYETLNAYPSAEESREILSKIIIEDIFDDDFYEEVCINVSSELDENNNLIYETQISDVTGNLFVTTTDSDGNVLKITNNSGSFWEFEHKLDVTEDKTIGNKLQSYTKSIVNGEEAATQEFLVKFESPNGYYREIQKTQNDVTLTEIIQYDRSHNIITHKDYDGNYMCAEYDENGIVRSYAFANETSEELLNNPSFELSNNGVADCWTSGENKVYEIVNKSYIDNSHGGSELKFSSNSTATMTVSQTVTSNFAADNTYVVGAWVKVDGTVTEEENRVGIEVKNSNGDSIGFAEFDNTLDGEWQYRLLAFKPESSCSTLDVVLTAQNQIGDIRFDEVTLFEASNSSVDLNNIVASSSVNTTYNADGTINSETLTDGIYSLNQAYVYDNKGDVVEKRDINGLTEYYKYSRYGKTVGTVMDDNGDFEDAKLVTYDRFGTLQTVTQTVKAVTTGDNKTLQTIYGTDDGKITSVYHNNVEYFFNYNPNGTLNSIEVLHDEDSVESTLIQYGYTATDDIGYIVYENGYKVEYIYNTDGNIRFVKCYSVDNTTNEEELLKTYTYTYNGNNLVSSHDSETGYTIAYNGEGFSYNTTRAGENESIELYSNVVNENGEKVETFRQAYFTGENYTPYDTITTSSTSVFVDSSTGNVTNSSSISVNKNSSDDKYSTMNYSRLSVTDYFNRITNKNTALVYETGKGEIYNVVSETNYEYKTLDFGITSGLISEYTTKISGDNANSNAGMNEYESYSRKYEYDHKGNVKYAYIQNGTTVTPKEYYEYDEANQLVTAIDFTGGEVVQYTYDASGNLASKVYYDYSNLNFDHDERTIISLGQPSYSDTFLYNASTTQYTYYRDDTKQYATSTIEFDEIGNPKNYVGIDVDNKIVTGNLEWNGNLLTKFENDSHRIEYEYDLNGYRSTKTVYDLKTGNGVDPMYKMTYIWDDGILTNLIYTGGDSEELSLNIIYDQDGSPVGYITSMGLPYYFIKDVNENVIGQVHADGTLMYSISYDAWGTPNYSYNGTNIFENFIIKATAIFNPITYHGYIYDYETGMYCSQGRCYSPVWGRYLNPENPVTLMDYSEEILDANLYLFCNNNPINNVDPYAMWSRDYVEICWTVDGFAIPMSDMFASRAFCITFANQLLMKYGEWDATNGYTYLGMNNLRIASDLFAHYVAQNAPLAIEKTNYVWGDKWLSSTQDPDLITINPIDENAWMYEKIWYAAPEIKAYAWNEGVFITL